MTNYIATIRHHSISRAREIECGPTLADAKRLAAEEFGSEQRDYEIAIYDASPGRAPDVVATRSVGAAKWRDRL